MTQDSGLSKEAWHLGPARRTSARPHDHGPRRADLRHHQLRVSRHGARGEPVRPAGVRQHLHPADEPHDRRPRKASGGARRRRGGAGVCQRPGGDHRVAADDRPRGAELHLRQQPLRRHVDPVHADLLEARHRSAVLRSRASRRRSASWSTRTPGPSTSKRRATRRTTCRTTARSPTSPTATGCRRSSTTRR